MSDSYLLIDGQFSQESDKRFPISLLDTLIFEERIRAVRNQMPFWDQHLELMNLKLKLFNQPIPSFLAYRGKELRRQIERTLVKNKLFRSARIQLYFIQNESGLSYLIKTDAIDAVDYQLNQTGLKVALFDKIPKGISPLSSLDLGSEPFWKIVNAELEKSMFDELLLVNQEASILEAPSKNIYALKGNKILTPAPQTGAYIDISQQKIQLISERLKIDLQFTVRLDEEMLLQADELFLVNSIDGISWIKAFKHKRYFNKTTKRIHQELNKLLLI
jgi:branched-subunit amino acid aminotransferase/4-amino-4-deoxychorismate lyase